jgi:amidophosphoribosyltransferase
MELPREACGLMGVFNHSEAATLSYLGLYALQHRGQESAGIVSCNGERLYSHKRLGLVSDVFNKENLSELKGNFAIGHVRYSTTGSSTAANAQPIVVNYKGGSLAVAHNGNFTNAEALKRELESRGAIFQTTTDSEILVHLIAQATSMDFHESLISSLVRLKGAYSLLMIHEDKLIALRDPRGFRPLCLGKLDGAHVVASESCALDIIDAEYVREIQPGEILTFSAEGITSEKPFADMPPSFCVFEYIYYSRPDSLIGGQNVYEFRHRLGEMLAEVQPADADVVIAVPDSSNPAALGYSKRSGIPFDFGLIRSHYVGRTFIEPDQAIRDFGARLKYNPVRSVLANKRIVVVDDSIVRGTTSGKIVKMIRTAGAREVHFRVSAPPWLNPCYYGIDTPREAELIANVNSVEAIRRHIGADSLGYMSLEGLKRVVPRNMSYCFACFEGVYPGGKPTSCQKESLEVFPRLSKR